MQNYSSHFTLSSISSLFHESERNAQCWQGVPVGCGPIVNTVVFGRVARGSIPVTAYFFIACHSLKMIVAPVLKYCATSLIKAFGVKPNVAYANGPLTYIQLILNKNRQGFIFCWSDYLNM